MAVNHIQEPRDIKRTQCKHTGNHLYLNSFLNYLINGSNCNAITNSIMPRLKGRTIRKVMGGGEFSGCTNFFSCSLLVHEFVFQVKPSARIFFQRNSPFFSVKS